MFNNIILALMVTLSLSGCSAALNYGLQEQGVRKNVDTNVKYCTDTVGNVTTWRKCGYK